METARQYPFNYSWSHAPLRFTLRTDDECVAVRAAEIFGYWDSAGAEFERQLSLNMVVEKTGAHWKFTGSQSDASTYFKDVASVIRALETDAALAVLEQHREVLTVHGALLAREDTAVLIVGPSGAGKSTISCAMWAAGWELLADDVSMLNPQYATALPLMRRISLRHPSRALLGEDFWSRMTAASTADPTPEGYVFHPDELEGRSRNRQARLACILFLRRLGALDPGPARVSPLLAAHALMALAPYTNVIRNEGMGEAIERLGPLVNQVPCYDLGRGPIADMVRSIDGLLRLEANVDSSR